MTVTETETLLAMAQAFVDRKYVTRADARQKEMGLAYIEAERQDLAREIVRFIQGLGFAQRPTEPLQCLRCGTVDAFGPVSKERAQAASGCICQNQHRRGYCTEPGCPYSVSSTARECGFCGGPLPCLTHSQGLPQSSPVHHGDTK